MTARIAAELSKRRTPEQLAQVLSLLEAHNARFLPKIARAKDLAAKDQIKRMGDMQLEASLVAAGLIEVRQ